MHIYENKQSLSNTTRMILLSFHRSDFNVLFFWIHCLHLFKQTKSKVISAMEKDEETDKGVESVLRLMQQQFTSNSTDICEPAHS